MSQIALWIDASEARIFHIDGAGFDETAVKAPTRHLHRHPKDQTTKVAHHPADETSFFAEVAAALAGSAPILVLGPAMTKLHFLRYLQKHDAALESRIVGLETADHPTDRQIVAHVRSYFHDAPLRAGK